MKKMKIAVGVVLACCFAAVMIYSGYRIWLIQADYNQEEKTHNLILTYKPEPTPSQPQDQPQETQKIVNQSVIDLQGQYSDAMGWLAIKGTRIDHPFVRREDNDYYLNHDINGKTATAGTIFMDSRCNPDFTSQNTIIYGHNMKNGSMFGTLKHFNAQDFFDENRYGTIYLPRDTMPLEFFAYMVINPAEEKELYNTTLSDGYIEYVRQNAKRYRDVSLTGSDKVVTLSTCAYDFNNARMVLLAKVK